MSYRQQIPDVLFDPSLPLSRFLLTRLQTEELVTCCNEHDIDEALHDMPDSLGGMYDRVLARITGRSKQQYARNVFTWMMYARRTLCVEELEWAIAFPENDQSELVLDPRMRMQDGANEVFRICWSLVTVIEPAAGSRKRFATVELAHSTVKEHLISSTWDRSATPWFSALRPIPSRRLMAQSLLSYLWYISQLPRAENHYSRTSWQYSLTWYAVQAWPEHANLCGAVAQPFDPSDPLHRLMQKLLQDATAMETLVKRLEPHMDSAQDIRKTLQDLQIIWYHTSLMRLGTLVKGSLPLSTCLYPRGPRRWMVRSAVNSIGDKLGTSTHGGESLFQTSRESEDAAVPPRDGNVLRELFREANHGWESQPFLELDLPQVGKEKGFRGSASVLRKVWVDNELDVAIVKIRDPTWSIALFPVVMHTSLFRGVR
jgi:hypothetical protein